jgi:hypothetical protein
MEEQEANTHIIFSKSMNYTKYRSINVLTKKILSLGCR